MCTFILDYYTSIPVYQLEKQQEGLKIQFSPDGNTNERMDEVLKIVGNFPDGITFNRLAELADRYVSRTTLVKWLEVFSEYHAVEITRGRHGQRTIIKSSGNYRNWLDLLNNIEIEIAFYRKEIERLGAISSQRQFDEADYFRLYKLQNNICRSPFTSYVTGMAYSQQVADYLRDAVDKEIRVIYAQLGNILEQQSEKFNTQPFNVFHQLETIMHLSTQLELLKKGKTKLPNSANGLLMSLSTAKQRLRMTLRRSLDKNE